MKVGIVVCLVAFMSVAGVQAQPGPFLQGDLQFAINVCSDTAYNTGVEQTGIGNVVDLDNTNRGCLAGNERQGTWMHFTAATGGKIGFTVLPAVASSDYDFAVWGPFADIPQALESLPIRCSYSALAGAGGLNYTEVDLSENASGSGWVRYLDVLASERYVLLVDNYSMNGIAFSLTWDLQDGATLECLPPTEAQFTPSAALVEAGGTVDFTDLSNNYPYAWWWEFEGGIPTNSLEQNPQDIAYGLTGCYDVSLTAYNATGESTTTVVCQVEVETNTGIADRTTGQFQVRQFAGSISIQPATSDAYEFQLVDAAGRMVRRARTHGPGTVGTAELPEGAYTLIIQDQNSRSVHRLVNIR